MKSTIPVFAFTSHGPERVIGDFLLARWNGDTNRECIRMESYIMIPDEPLKYLATIRGSLEFAQVIPRNGNLWAYLIPAEVPVGKWDKSNETIRTGLSLAQVASQLPPINSPQRTSHFVFKAVPPGEYKFKFIWERNPPAGRWRTNHYTAQPGDYETVESRPITVKAGETVHGLILSCTNRVGDGKAYAADEALLMERKK